MHPTNYEQAVADAATTVNEWRENPTDATVSRMRAAADDLGDQGMFAYAGVGGPELHARAAAILTASDAGTPEDVAEAVTDFLDLAHAWESAQDADREARNHARHLAALADDDRDDLPADTLGSDRPVTRYIVSAGAPRA